MATAEPSNPHSQLTLIVGVIVGAVLVVIIVIAVLVTIKYRYNSLPSLARMQSFLNPNYSRFDDNNTVSGHWDKNKQNTMIISF